jgi:uncharacterized protein YndB with AHSA1/START domain
LGAGDECLKGEKVSACLALAPRIHLAIMHGMNDRKTVVSTLIKAPPEAVYRAFIDRNAVAAWLPPGRMRGIVHAFEPREGGAFSMSLVYPPSEAPRGKTSEHADTFVGRFVELVPNELVVWATRFESADPSLAGEMIVRTTLVPQDNSTQVTITCENIPRGVKLDDNEAGCRASLQKLASYLAEGASR